jgi:hypothetical protein
VIKKPVKISCPLGLRVSAAKILGVFSVFSVPLATLSPELVEGERVVNPQPYFSPLHFLSTSCM